LRAAALLRRSGRATEPARSSEDPQQSARASS
jgi:hypothetical protein